MAGSAYSTDVDRHETSTPYYSEATLTNPPQRIVLLHGMCTAHTTCYKCTSCGRKAAMTLFLLTECDAFLAQLSRARAQDRETILRGRMAAGLFAPVHLVGTHSLWAWNWTGSDDGFIIYPRRICIEARHFDIEWECSDCNIPPGVQNSVWRMIRDGLRGEQDGGEKDPGRRAASDKVRSMVGELHSLSIALAQ